MIGVVVFLVALVLALHFCKKWGFKRMRTRMARTLGRGLPESSSGTEMKDGLPLGSNDA